MSRYYDDDYRKNFFYDDDDDFDDDEFDFDDDDFDFDDDDYRNVRVNEAGTSVKILKGYRDDEFEAEDYGRFLVTIDGSAAVTHKLEIEGNKLSNVIIGGKGNDKIWGKRGNDTLTGGKGNDVFVYFGDGSEDVIADYGQGDRIKISGGKVSQAKLSDSDVILSIGNGSLTVKEGKGKTLKLIDSYGRSISTIIGGDSPSPTDETKDLKLTNSAKSPFILPADVENVDASSRTRAINITGNKLDNEISGGSKKDTIYGGRGNDLLVGNQGNDKLYGGDGNDTLQGGKGNDSLWGSDDDNTFIYSGGDGKDVIFGFDDDDMLKITGEFSASYNRSKREVAFKVDDTSKAITLKNFDTTTFNVNGEFYQISGTKFAKK